VRLLVVDDFRTMRRVLRSQLRAMGLDDVVEAGDGAAALERLRAEPVDIVITDIEMPTMNGFELLVAIKKDPRLKQLPVLVLAAEARKDDIVRCVQAGAAAWLVKPFGRAALEEKLRQVAPGCFVAG
jgi:two-component system chemotaxis response regulator CheY